MGNPTIFSGRYTKLLTNQGILNSNGSVNCYDGTKNYIPYAQFEQNITTGWSLFNTSLTSGLPTGTVSAGAASITTFATTGTNPLAGFYSLQIAGSAAISAGQGFISSAFTVDRCDYGKVLTFKFCYEAVTNPTNANWSGQLGSQSFAVYIYDVTAAAWVQPTGFLGMNQSLNAGQVTGTFQSSVVSGQQYQIAVICLQATAGAITINFDSISVSPQVNPIGAAMTDWTAYTPTFTGFGTVSTQSFSYRRVGSEMEIRGRFVSGTPTATEARISFPSGLTAASTITTLENAGQALKSTGAATTTFGFSVLMEPSVSYLTFGYQISTTAPLNKQNGNVWCASGDVISFVVSVPISGWSSNVQMSNDTSTSVVVAIVSGAPANATAANPIIFPTVIKDTNAAYSATTGKYTIPVSGYYEIESFFTGTVPANGLIQAYVDGVAQSPSMGVYYNTSGTGVGTVTIYATAGQLVDIRCAQNTTGFGVSTGASFKRVSGPSVIAANELVSAKYYASANGTATSTTPVNYDSKIYDSHNSVTTGSAWKFTAPRSGKYSLKSYLNYTTAPSSTCLITIYKNGANLEVFGGVFLPIATASMSTSFALNAGDTIQITSNNANYNWQGGTYGTVTGLAPCVIEIESLGY